MVKFGCVTTLTVDAFQKYQICSKSFVVEYFSSKYSRLIFWFGYKAVKANLQGAMTYLYWCFMLDLSAGATCPIHCIKMERSNILSEENFSRWSDPITAKACSRLSVRNDIYCL